MKPSGYGEFFEALLDKPSVPDNGRCAICGRPAHDKHHVVQKGIGGVSDEIEARIPTMPLCGAGNASGCHGLMHARKLHVYWDEAKGGLVFWYHPSPMGDLKAWIDHGAEYLPVPWR